MPGCLITVTVCKPHPILTALYTLCFWLGRRGPVSLHNLFPKKKVRHSRQPGQNSGQNHPKSNFQKGCEFLPRGAEKWLGIFSYWKNRPKFFGRISAQTSRKCLGLFLQNFVSGRKSLCNSSALGLAKHWQQKGSSGLKPLEQTLLVCLLRLHWDSNLRGSQNAKLIFLKVIFRKRLLHVVRH